MQTITINVDNKSNAEKIFEALHLFKGVTDIRFVVDSESEIMDEIELSLKQAKQIRDGNLPRKSLKQMLDGQ